jgi:hypothetical protein
MEKMENNNQLSDREFFLKVIENEKKAIQKLQNYLNSGMNIVFVLFLLISLYRLMANIIFEDWALVQAANFLINLLVQATIFYLIIVVFRIYFYFTNKNDKKYLDSLIVDINTGQKIERINIFKLLVIGIFYLCSLSIAVVLAIWLCKIIDKFLMF